MSHKRPPSEVELNIASMLDMAFQLLTFFILTFHPPPVEGQIGLRLPPPQPAMGQGTANPGAVDQKGVEPVTVKTLAITVHAVKGGQTPGTIEDMWVNTTECKTFRELNKALREIFQNPECPYKQVIVQANPGLHYGDLMAVVNVCASQKYAQQNKKLDKLSFVELPDNAD
ncbi:MAG: ExbD/TolR family protein [Thermoguttaceae bacterium]